MNIHIGNRNHIDRSLFGLYHGDSPDTVSSRLTVPVVV